MQSVTLSWLPVEYQEDSVSNSVSNTDTRPDSNISKFQLKGK